MNIFIRKEKKKWWCILALLRKWWWKMVVMDPLDAKKAIQESNTLVDRIINLMLSFTIHHHCHCHHHHQYYCGCDNSLLVNDCSYFSNISTMGTSSIIHFNAKAAFLTSLTLSQVISWPCDCSKISLAFSQTCSQSYLKTMTIDFIITALFI